MHKATPQARFIAASSSVFTTPLAKALNIMLGAVKKALKARDEIYHNRTGIRRCWFVDSYEEVSLRLRSLVRPTDPTQRCVSTYDFTTMYTTLAQNSEGGIVESVGFALKEAFGDQTYLGDDEEDLDIPLYRYLVYQGPSKPIRWELVGGPPIQAPASHKFTVAEILRLVRLLINSTYIKNGDCIRRQVTGLPMGTNPAPHLADLTCYPHEARAMDRLRRVSPSRARQFTGTCRYIDDILSPDHPSFSSFVRLADEPDRPQVEEPIYPPFLGLKCTSEQPGTAEYLGMTITSQPKSFIFKITNTKKRFPVAKVNYPSLYGNFPSTLAYGVLTGQLHRFARVCTTANDFILNTIQLCHALKVKGYVQHKMFKSVDNFLQACNPYKTPWVAICRRVKYGFLDKNPPGEVIAQ
jgi:hypothetical protein